MSLRKLFMSGCLALMITAAAPAKASADWLFTPFIGMNWGRSIDFDDDFGDFEDELEKRVDFGASLAWMGAGIIGFEVDFGYSPNFFERTEGDEDFDFGGSNVTTLMANLMVGIPIGGQTGFGIRPYASGGLGLVRSGLGDFGDLFDVDASNDLGFNLGGGVSGFFTDNIGVRGDVRYFRSFAGDDDDDDDLDLDDLDDFRLGGLRFWRGSVGVTFRF